MAATRYVLSATVYRLRNTRCILLATCYKHRATGFALRPTGYDLRSGTTGYVLQITSALYVLKLGDGLGHTLRRDPGSRSYSQASDGKPQGKRKCGRPQKPILVTYLTTNSDGRSGELWNDVERGAYVEQAIEIDGICERSLRYL